MNVLFSRLTINIPTALNCGPSSVAVGCGPAETQRAPNAAAMSEDEDVSVEASAGGIRPVQLWQTGSRLGTCALTN